MKGRWIIWANRRGEDRERLSLNITTAKVLREAVRTLRREGYKSIYPVRER